MSRYQSPLQGNPRLSSGFGRRKSPTKGASSNHKGNDYAVKNGTPVYAAADGVVLKGGSNATGYGKTIMVNHPQYGESTVVAHMQSSVVKVGQTVKQGDLIGYSDNTGRSSGAHVHFDIAKNKSGTQSGHYNGKKINPEKYLGADGEYHDHDHEGEDHNDHDGEPAEPCPPRGQNAGNGGMANPTPSQQETINRIKATLDKRTDLTQADKDYILATAARESNFNPNAKNPKSTAKGLFQFLDSTRNNSSGYAHDPYDIEATTNAMADFVIKEQRPYEEYFQKSGFTAFHPSIPITNGMGPAYAQMTRDERMYALFHGNGIGNSANAPNGKGGGSGWKHFRDHHRRTMARIGG